MFYNDFKMVKKCLSVSYMMFCIILNQFNQCLILQNLYKYELYTIKFDFEGLKCYVSKVLCF